PVSIPNGLPQPFSQAWDRSFECNSGVSIPNGLPQPFSPTIVVLALLGLLVSIPNGLPQPFSLKAHGMGHTIMPTFQSLTGSPNHLAKSSTQGTRAHLTVSIPNRLPQPFSPGPWASALCAIPVVSIPNGLPQPFS